MANMTFEQARQNIGMLFTRLGDTPGEVASNLKKARIRGERGSESSCPLGIGIGRILTRNIKYTIWAEVLFLFEDTRMEAVSLPSSVVQFIQNFDAGAYGDLARE